MRQQKANHITHAPAEIPVPWIATGATENVVTLLFVEETLSMNRQARLICASIACALGLTMSAPASALTMKECSAKYEAAKKAGTLKGMKWNDFRKAECGAEAKATSAPAKEKKTTSTTKTKSAAEPMKATNAVFPTKVSPKYSKETPGKARLHTCVDQYNANKAKNANGGMKWIEKGGGYWSECNKRLKG
jgi:hypothetical protein